MNFLWIALLALSWGAEDKPRPAGVLEARWQGLLDAKKPAEARTLCQSWAASKDRAELTESHKCLASLAAGEGKTDAALTELEAAVNLSPADLSAHEGRLHVLVGARRFSELPVALEKSLKAYPGEDGLEVWLSVSAELLDQDKLEEGLAYTHLLEKAFPKDHRVLANMGTLLAAAGRREEALPYLKRAVALEPNDALDNWNLGKLYDELGKIELAEKFYKKSLAVERESEQKKESACAYAEFLKKHKKPGAAAYQRKNCPAEEPEDD
ncbi:MAG: tetratricopeptide repeat protein [Elusimicrobia bacterium]|nr:tetratricopeptide repeat protein [Elusimicrobiota bacterium]